MDVSLQLYTIRSETKQDFKEAVRRVGKTGYDGVEFAGYGDLSAEEMKELLQESGLYSVASHTPQNVFLNSFEEDLKYNSAIGSKYIICPHAKMETRQEVDAVTDMLNKAAALAAPYGIKVGYHNHNHEFKKIDGKYILDIIAENTSDDVVLELDVYWVHNGGEDPVEYIKKWGSKVELIHCKQVGGNGTDVDIPDGVIDMKKVIETAKYAKYFIVEQEAFEKPIWETMQRTVDYLKSL